MGTLRLLLALSIVAFHAGPILGSKWMGAEAVPAFFIISGFYMALILDGKYGDAWSFYKSRLLRLFPLYWAFLLIVVAIAVAPSLPSSFGANLNYVARLSLARATDGSPAAWLSAMPNLFMVGSEWVRQLVYDPAIGVISIWRNGVIEGPQVRGVYFGLIVPQNWSLAVELTFYLVAPWLAKRETATLIVICVAAFLGWHLVDHGLAFPHLLPSTNLWLFVLGMLVYRLMPFTRRMSVAHQIALAIIPVAIFVLWSPLSGRLQPGPMLMVFALGLPALFWLTRLNEYDRLIGELSYPIYITHLLFQFPSAVFGTYAGYVCALVSIVVSIVLYLVIQVPVDRYRHRVTAVIAA